MRRDPLPSHERWGSVPEGFFLQVILVGFGWSRFGRVAGRGGQVVAVYISAGRYEGLQKSMTDEYLGPQDYSV